VLQERFDFFARTGTERSSKIEAELVRSLSLIRSTESPFFFLFIDSRLPSLG